MTYITYKNNPGRKETEFLRQEKSIYNVYQTFTKNHNSSPVLAFISMGKTAFLSISAVFGSLCLLFTAVFLMGFYDRLINIYKQTFFFYFIKKIFSYINK